MLPDIAIRQILINWIVGSAVSDCFNYNIAGVAGILP